ncbi:MAG: UDP-N-acetylmuramoyl-tripeptide--D-alanyl-D-alanine ligase [Halanaerobiaceae bacterium]
MKPLTIKTIIEAVSGKLIQGSRDILIKSVSTDTRTLKSGELFIALRGEKHDAHNFVSEAVRSGAAALIVDKNITVDERIPIIRVDDTTKALQDLASYYRLQFPDLPVIAITGSTGKTTTKDILAAILKEKYTVLKSRGNYNNYIGLPLTLFRLTGREDIAVLELGMSELGEIESLTSIARPETGIITNVGPTHLEFLKTVENVALGKSELIKGLPTRGTAILNYDNKYVRDMAGVFSGKKIIYYGFEPKADVYCQQFQLDKENFSTDFVINYYGRKKRLKINKPGKFIIYNSLAAIAAAREYEVSWQQIERGLMAVELSSLRLDIQQAAGMTVINDTYNANPLSMKAAIDSLLNMADRKTIAVLGAMLELGPREQSAHLELGEYAARSGIDILITVGELGKIIAEGALNSRDNLTVIAAENNNEAATKLLELGKENDTVLLKGSRAVKMEEILTLIKGEDK